MNDGHDHEVRRLVALEAKRQDEVLEMIPSENYVSREVRRAVGSEFMNKYAEGYPGRRYYQGNEAVDRLEKLAIARTREVFGVPFANVQPLSGGPANLAIIRALLLRSDVQLSQHLSTGGHLSMGQEASITHELAKSVFYHLTPQGEIDWDELKSLAVTHRPRVIWSGGTGYTRVFNWERYAEIADEVGAYFVADISHIGGLVAGGAHPSPVPFAHVVMTTTHKTLRGPRGAVILVTDRGLAKDGDLGTKIDKAVFPGVQGGPHMETVAGIAVAMGEAMRTEFREYAARVVENAKGLAAILSGKRYELVGGGSENHMIWVDLRSKGLDGWAAAWGLEASGIVANRQTIPGEKGSPYYPSGLRLGTPAVTTRGMRISEMGLIGDWIDQSIRISAGLVRERFLAIGGGDRELDQQARKQFKLEVFRNREFSRLRSEVKQLCRRFPVP